MFRSPTSAPGKPIRHSLDATPEYPWVNDASTLNPAPGPLLKERRDTAEGCRDRAAADLLAAVAMTTSHGRHMLEQSAAAWSIRAELLQQVEPSSATPPVATYLTPGEIAEDAAYVRL